jgi:excisionase family DNA binding protein
VKLLDVQIVAAFLGVSRQTVDRMISDGRLDAICIRSGRRKKILRIPDSSLKKFLHLPRGEALTIEPALIHETKKENLYAAVDGNRKLQAV